LNLYIIHIFGRVLKGDFWFCWLKEWLYMNLYAKCTDGELMKEIKAGNMLAFDELYRKYSKRLFKFSYSILKTTEDAENIIQDVFLNLWLNREKVEKSTSVKYYIFAIAHNSAISIIRKRIKETVYIEHVKSLQNLIQEPVDLKVEYNELNKILEGIINSLPNQQKKVFLLNRIEELKYREIAEKLNISINTVENHMSRALKNIREKLREYSVTAVLFYSLFL
jgi:RNA polymerase sigma-70 factor, ECF subfamily